MTSPIIFLRVVLVVSLFGMAFHYLADILIPSRFVENSKIYQRFQSAAAAFPNAQLRRALREPKAYDRSFLLRGAGRDHRIVSDPSDTAVTGCICTCLLGTGEEGRAMQSLDEELVDVLGGDPFICIPVDESDGLLSRGTGTCDNTCL